MKPLTASKPRHAEFIDRLDEVHLSGAERARAKSLMRDTELVADILLRAAEDIHAFVSLIERRLGRLSKRIKSLLVKPARS